MARSHDRSRLSSEIPPQKCGGHRPRLLLAELERRPGLAKPSPNLDTERPRVWTGDLELETSSRVPREGCAGTVWTSRSVGIADAPHFPDEPRCVYAYDRSSEEIDAETRAASHRAPHTRPATAQREGPDQWDVEGSPGATRAARACTERESPRSRPMALGERGPRAEDPQYHGQANPQR